MQLWFIICVLNQHALALLSVSSRLKYGLSATEKLTNRSTGFGAERAMQLMLASDPALTIALLLMWETLLWKEWRSLVSASELRWRLARAYLGARGRA